jgi:hypothetical protein
MWKGRQKDKSLWNKLEGSRDPSRPYRRWNSQNVEQVIGLILELEEEKKKMNKN